MAFVDFPEQQQVSQLLQRSLERNRLAHAYLFTGNSLDELEAMAGTLAKTLNCQNPPQRNAAGLPMESCDACSSCRRIQGFNHPDVYWVRPESKSRVITIDQTRELMQTINLKPSEASYKVAVLVAADRMNVQAANAFLKTLEEPPSRSILILLSVEPQRLLETILSRCLRLSFAGEAGRFEPARAAWLFQFGTLAAEQDKGGLLGRYRLLGALLKRLSEQKAEIEKGLTARSPLERHPDADTKLRDKWEDELTAAIEAEYRRQRSDLLVGLQWWMRDVWLQTLAMDAEMLTFPPAESKAPQVARRLAPEDAMRNLQVLEQMQRLLNTNVQEALALEVGLLKMKF